MMGISLSNWLYRANNLGLRPYKIIIIVALSLMATAAEVFGIGILLPVFQFIQLNGDLSALVESSGVWQHVISVFDFFSIKPSLEILLLIVFGSFVVKQLITYVRLIYIAAVTQKITQIQQNQIFNKYIDADTSYHDSVTVGDLTNIMTTEVYSVVRLLMAPMEIIVYLVMLVGYISILFLLSWQMTMTSIVVLIFASGVPYVWIKKSAQTGRKVVRSNTLMLKFLVERLRSPRLVRLSGTEIAEKNEFYNLTQKQRKHSVFRSVLQAKTDVMVEPVIVGFSIIFLYFSYTVLQLQTDVIGIYLVVILRLMPVVKGIIMRWQTIQVYLGSMEAVESHLQSMQDSIEIDNGGKDLSRLHQSISFNKVSYQYSKTSVEVLKNISIKFEIGKMTAIVGPSGSGKSTLIDLLPRLRTPTKGIIQIDGVDSLEYSLKSIRKMTAYVPQSPQIFDGTIKDHILYGKKKSTDDEIKKAVYLAGAEDFISQLPKKLDTELGEDASRLSGGQKQRLDLARAIIRNAPILILDEPTSNLDAESEDMFKKSLVRIRKETDTVIIIVAHRLLSICDADNIIVLNQGEVESSGNHLELLKKSKWYSNAWKVQSN